MKFSSVMKACLIALAALVCIYSAPAMAADSQPAPTAGAAVDDSYRLGPDDKVRIMTFGEDALSGEFTVSGKGTISLPLIGEIKAVGLNTTELQAAIEHDYREGYLRDPKVSVEIITFRPYYILGEVTRPGEYPYTNGLTALNAVATANGFTYRADMHHVFIKHAGETKETRYDLTSSTPVAPGDTIRIKERLF
jgi:polysaccharide export outer membrane protein